MPRPRSAARTGPRTSARSDRLAREREAREHPRRRQSRRAASAAGDGQRQRDREHEHVERATAGVQTRPAIAPRCRASPSGQQAGARIDATGQTKNSARKTAGGDRQQRAPPGRLSAGRAASIPRSSGSRFAGDDGRVQRQRRRRARPRTPRNSTGSSAVAAPGDTNMFERDVRLDRRDSAGSRRARAPARGRVRAREDARELDLADSSRRPGRRGRVWPAAGRRR